MKNYRRFVPIVLVLLYGVSLYSLIDSKAATEKVYEGYLKAARDSYEEGITVDAESYYNQALGEKQTLELSLEIGEFYLNTNQTRKAEEWGYELVDKYPKEAAAYEFLVKQLIAQKQYAESYQLNDTFRNRKLESETFSEYINMIKYEHFFKGEYDEVGAYAAGLCPVQVGEKWGYIKLNGDSAVGGKFAKAGIFAQIGSGADDVRAPVVDLNGEAYYIDSKGNKKIVAKDIDGLEELGMLASGALAAYNGESWSFYDMEFNLLFGEYEEVSALGNGIAAVMEDGDWYLVNIKGETLTNKSYVDVAMDEKQVVYRNGCLFVNEGSGYYMINGKGERIGTQTFEDVRIFNEVTNTENTEPTTFAAVKVGGKWGFIDHNGNMCLEAQYEDARSFSNGHAAVKIDGKWGFINRSGELVIEPQFDDAKDFNTKGCVFVKRSGQWELLCLYSAVH